MEAGHYTHTPPWRDVDDSGRGAGFDGWSGVGGKLRVGVMWEDGVVRPVKPTRRTLQTMEDKLRRLSGVELVDFAPESVPEIWKITAQLYYIDGGRKLREAFGEEPMYPLTKWIVSQARELSTEEVTELVNRRNALRQRYSALFQSLHLDVILCPASPAPALPFHTSKYWSYTSLFNFLDWPGVVFPTGVQVTLDDQDADYEPRNEDEQHVYSTYSPETCIDAPIGLQLAAPRWHDERLMAASRIIDIEDIIELLELQDLADSMTGFPGFGLSMQARKRVTIGVELAAKHDLLLFVDEPTSGLDGQSVYNIVRLVRKLTAGQKILCKIHQPNALLFQSLDRLLLLQRDGECVYFDDIGPDQAKAVVEASSKLGRVWLTTIPFQPSLRVTDFEIAAALQLGTLAGAKHIIGQDLSSIPGTRVRLEPLGHQTSRRNDIQVLTLLGSQATGLANAEYDLTVVSLASKESRATSLPEQDQNPSRLVNKYLDCVADHKVRHRPTSNLPFHPIVLSLGGMMNGSTTTVFASWKQVMIRGTYNLMLKRLSLCLLQARVRSFEL
ncbi:hypothetical protein EHS25_004747 [Saitozyma podzolica]|uniref:Amidase domain-containing protein n=1 Tax=Saitozyma podzolica TaxID=1890683 RepID=A0A427Y2P8_9TREE|nr:hypothetical protein EHS25_004747 [Saitozyma podzolica]